MGRSSPRPSRGRSHRSTEAFAKTAGVARVRCRLRGRPGLRRPRRVAEATHKRSMPGNRRALLWRRESSRDAPRSSRPPALLAPCRAAGLSRSPAHGRSSSRCSSWACPMWSLTRWCARLARTHWASGPRLHRGLQPRLPRGCARGVSMALTRRHPLGSPPSRRRTPPPRRRPGCRTL